MKEKIVVAHRGLSQLYPENTLLAIEQAILAGAEAVEFDIQLSEDHVPIVYHDATLERMSNKPGYVYEKPWLVLQTYQAHYAGPFSEEFKNTPISSLAETVTLLQNHPNVTACVEIKEESVAVFGVDIVVDNILKDLDPIIDQVLFLSFSAEVIENLHKKGQQATCWVLRHYDLESLCLAKIMSPEVLAVNQNKLPTMGKALWDKKEGISSDWMIYHTETPETVDHLFSLGAKYVETDNIRHIAEHRPEYFPKDKN